MSSYRLKGTDTGMVSFDLFAPGEEWRGGSVFPKIRVPLTHRMLHRHPEVWRAIGELLATWETVRMDGAGVAGIEIGIGRAPEIDLWVHPDPCDHLADRIRFARHHLLRQFDVACERVGIETETAYRERVEREREAGVGPCEAARAAR